MKPAARNLFVVLMFLAAAGVAAALLSPRAPAAPAPSSAAAISPAPETPAPRARDLLARGTQDQFWAATVVPSRDRDTPGEKTVIRFRAPGDGLQWRLFAELAARAVEISDHGAELLVLLDNGDWKFVSDSGVRSGIT